MLKQLADLLLNAVLPPFCCHCKKFGTLLCHDCYEKIEFLTLPAEIKLNSCYLDKITAAGNYRGVLASLIKTLKYQSVKNTGHLLGKLLYETVDIPSTDIFCPVPLHPKRQKQRGFNQANLIAQEIGLITNTPVLEIITRTRHTPNQASLLNRSQRLSNLNNAFSLSLNAKQVVANLNITLVDDVLTTGTTLNECARVLKKAGVKRVEALVVAHRA